MALSSSSNSFFPGADDISLGVDDVFNLANIGDLLNRRENPESKDPFGPTLSRNPRLPQVLDDPKKGTYWHKPWEGSAMKLDFAMFHRLLRAHVYQPQKGVIIVEEIGSREVFMLKRVFPGLDIEFVHRHVARTKSTTTQAERIHVAHDVQIEPLSGYVGEPKHSFGFHFDGRCVPSTTGDRHNASNGSTDLAMSFVEDPVHYGRKESFMPSIFRSPIPCGRGYRHETLVKHGETWHRASTRISCCMLDSDLCRLYVPFNRDSWKQIVTDCVQTCCS